MVARTARLIRIVVMLTLRIILQMTSACGTLICVVGRLTVRRRLMSAVMLARLMFRQTTFAAVLLGVSSVVVQTVVIMAPPVVQEIQKMLWMTTVVASFLENAVV